MRRKCVATPLQRLMMFFVGLLLCALSEAFWDFLTAYAFVGYRFDSALHLGERRIAENLHLGMLLIALIWAAALVSYLLRRRSSKKSAARRDAVGALDPHAICEPMARR